MESDIPWLALHLLWLLLTPPFFLGVIAKTKAFFAGRKGPPLFQAYYDLSRLGRKGSVVSRSSSLILRLSPPVIFLGVFLAALLVPLFGPAPFHFEGDLILFASLLGLARFFTILAAMDVGSSFEGMGASRLTACIRAAALQGAMLSVLPVLARGSAFDRTPWGCSQGPCSSRGS